MVTTPARRIRLTQDEWEAKEAALGQLLSPCRICPRRCGVTRSSGERGRCLVGERALLARACLHRGEEPVISGTRGAGTLFFAGCQLRCVYCQNHQISQGATARREPRRDAIQMIPLAEGRDLLASWETSVEALARVFLDLAAQGAHNLEWVSPTPHLPFLVSALRRATELGMLLPVVFNSSGYESVATLKLLEDVIDVYLPDLKYAEPRVAGRLSAAPDYPEVAFLALEEMWRQVGPLTVDDDGVARRGVLVRHLLLPGRWRQCEAVLEGIERALGRGVWISLMAQYHPEHHAAAVPDLNRCISAREYDRALESLDVVGLEEGFVQELDAAGCYRPDFERRGHPFEPGVKMPPVACHEGPPPAERSR